MISTQQWLATVPEELTIYVMLGSISDAKPVAAYFTKTKQINLTALWQETSYASWFEAMPYIAPIERNSPFLEWVDETKSQNWGWLAASPYDPETIRKHFKSLTKVLMPDSMDVFFRYWDGRYIYPILTHLKDQAGQVIPVFSHYLINQQTVDINIPNKLPEPKAYPWWKVDQQLLDKLVEEDNTALINNLLMVIKTNHPQLYFSYPENTIKSKARHFVDTENYNLEKLAQQFTEYLAQENV
ncbi:DUF4123 domain-containing protein [Entomomonas asaccharolytica]|uniref:DUF4123 domain-containing protein n=1 Tax=Entomomonas asaccharolytica TaxID=2785331 RepID=A0A974NF12_9GAMM|nr:DUF4123 domain-containing protein [Entomomonas asaccharolytica]QQP85530.1 DUF4123 domain-containing protein [Entomomonas asaccharolytica]